MKLFEATLTAHHVLSNSTDTAGLHSPAVLASDPDNGIVVQEHVADARMLAELAVASERDSDLLLGAMTSAGRAIASLHAVSASGKGLRSDPSFLPPVEWLDVLPWTSFKTFAAPQLNIWGRLQRDPELKDALMTLRAEEARAMPVAIHGDLRLDQFLLDSSGKLWLIDWEEFRMGDPARDVGAIVGEWLHIAIASLHGRAPERFGHLLEIDLTHDDILEAGASAIDDTVPFSVAFWEEYTQLTAISRDFQRRVVMFAGWHLFDRLLATGEIRSRASALDWAGAGIGRQALLNPENVAAALGLGLRSNEPAHV